MGVDEGEAKRRGRRTAARLQKQIDEEKSEAVRSALRIAGLAGNRPTQTRSRPAIGGGLGGQAQRTGGAIGGRIGGPLGSRGPATP